MKNNHIILSLLFAASALAFTGCENFLNQPAYDDFTDAEYWQNEDQARTYMYGFYTSVFSGYGTGTSHGPFLMGQTTNDDFASDKQQLNLRPEAVPVSDGSWSFSNIRKANYVLENIDRIDANAATKNHWRGVARFFRACYYSSRTSTTSTRTATPAPTWTRVSSRISVMLWIVSARTMGRCKSTVMWWQPWRPAICCARARSSSIIISTLIWRRSVSLLRVTLPCS